MYTPPSRTRPVYFGAKTGTSPHERHRLYKVDYSLQTLMDQIALGMIGLPDIQRPFVWKNSKVRDLFDSMYRGYPVGYLLLWRNGLADDKTIGVGDKQKTPSLVIVDGQQRLTSLYAVTRGKPVVRKNYDSERIRIAFNPLEHRFEVADAATQRDKAFIPDVSRVWLDGLFDVARDYLAGLRLLREVNGQEERAIQDAITRLSNLLTFVSAKPTPPSIRRADEIG